MYIVQQYTLTHVHVHIKLCVSFHSFYRSVAEWVKQTEDAGVLDTPPPPPDSPTCSDTFSFTSAVSINIT